MSKSFAFRLMTYFLLISLLPILVLSFYFYTSVSRTLNANLADQANQSLDRVIASLSDCLDDYRHRSYAISVSDTIRRELSQQGSVPSQEIYQQLYQSMRGTIYDASAHIISSDGRNKYSTHEFPDHYDLRYNSNDVSIASMLASFTTPTLLLAERYSNKRQDLVVLNLIRAITDSDGTLLGYVIIDLFSTTISNLCNESVFSDIILIDRLTLKAYSLLHTDTFGDYNRFPALTEPSTTSGFDTVRLTSNQIIAQKPIRSTQFSIAGIIETPPYTMLLNRISWVSLIVLALSVAAALLFAYFASKHISKPVSTLVSAMKQVEEGNLEIRVHETHDTNEIQSLNMGFNQMIGKTKELLELTKEEEKQLRAAERKALQAQINPHFLYNTLYTIKALATLHGERQILQITTAMGKLLRSSISSNNDTLPLAESLELVRSYLTIVQIRYPGKLSFTIDVQQDCNTIVTPKLIIQPFVENSVTHGLEPKIGEWKIRIDGFDFRGKTAICIRDNGIGFQADNKKGDDVLSSEHIGIQNVRSRLALFYQNKAELKITGKKGVGTVVRILLPKD